MFKNKFYNFLVFIFFSFYLSTLLYASTVSEKYYEGLKAFEKGKYKKSISIFKKILKQNPQTEDLGKIQTQIAKAYEELGKFKKAFDSYEIIFIKYPEYNELEDIVKRQYNIAEKYYNGEMKSLFGIDFAESNKTALNMYGKIIGHFPYGEFADISLLKSIKILINSKDYDKIDEKIKQFKKNYENSQYSDEVHYLDGYNYYLQIKDSAYDQSNTKTSIEKFKYYIEVFPQGKFLNEVTNYLKELNDRICENKFNTAMFYKKNNNINGMKNYLNDIIKNFPDTMWAEKAKEKLGHI